MFMVDMRLDPAKLMRFAHAHGHPLSSDEDHGYAAHAWLAAATGRMAPKPFRLLERQGGLRLLGYSLYGAGDIRRHAERYAEPQAFEVCDWNCIAAKPMPDTWKPGTLLGFEVRACPVSRGERERDVFLSALDRAKAMGTAPPRREAVYFDWLRRSMMAACEPGGDFLDSEGRRSAPTVELIAGRISILGLRRVKVFRRNSQGGASSKRTFERPDVLFSGELLIREPKGFGALLERGVGRHRAFGFGMLLLRPPGPK